MSADLTLLVPEKPDVERDAVADAWRKLGGSVVRLGRFWDPPTLDTHRVRVYGNDTFCLVLAEKLRLDLVTPDDALVLTAPQEFLGRRLLRAQLRDLSASMCPAFVKSLIPKQFSSSVYASRDALLQGCAGLNDDTEILISEIVRFVAEARSFILDGMVRACAVYEGLGNPDHAATFAERIARALNLPKTALLDVGLLPDGKWVLVEINATWGAGLNGCRAEDVVPCIAAATRTDA